MGIKGALSDNDVRKCPFVCLSVIVCCQPIAHNYVKLVRKHSKQINLKITMNVD